MEDMKGNLEFSPKLGYAEDNDDVKYVSGLSTILVATIQEAKDRISQIEYIFCSQLYPNFQSKSKSLLRIYSEVKRDAEDSWKEKEKDFLCEIEKLKVEKRQIEEETCGLKVEKEKISREQGERTEMLLVKVRSQESRIAELEGEVMRKAKEVDEGMELQNKLLELVQTKANMIVDKGKQLKENEDKTNRLLAKVKGLEQKIEELQEEIRENNEKIAKEKDLNEKIDFLRSELIASGKLLAECEEEKKKLMRKLEHVEENAVELEKKLKKMEETGEGKALQAQLLHQIDTNAVEILKQKEQLEDSENEKKRLVDKLSNLEKKVIELQENVSRSSMVAEGKDSYEKLLQRIELKETELLAEKKKRTDISEAYKRLKSQYNFLCTKCGLTAENMRPLDKLVDESGSLKYQKNPTTLQDIKNKNSDTFGAVGEMKKVKTENEFCDGLGPIDEMKKMKNKNEFSDDLEDVKGVKSIGISSFQFPSSSHIIPKCPSPVKSGPVIGTKRSASCWIDTRSHQRKDGPDPHDDFLDTPLENLRANLNKTMEEDVHDGQASAQRSTDPGSSDDETQDVSLDICPREQQIAVPMTGKKGFKYVEPVRKKAERENLKGVECKQCKKFYDAVLPNTGGKHADCNKQNFRCEHQDGVSRHRYKYMPPMTPEGFWNIGFESEM